MILVPATMVRFSSHRGIFFVLSLYAFAASVVAASSSLSEKPIEKKAYNNHDDYYEPTMFTMQELAQGTRPDDLLLALQTSGMIAIAHDDEEDENANDNFSATATVALDQWCQCNDHFRHNNDHNHDDITKHIPSTQVIALEPNGGTTRTTLATATVGNENPLALDAHVADVCGVTAATQLDALRDVVHEASVAFVQALDDLILGGGNGGGIGSKNNNYLSLLRDVHGKTYPTVQSIVQAATHLEHYHLYEKQKKQDESMLKTKDDDDKKTKTLDFHTDAGLFLAFVPGYDCDATDMTTSSTLDNFWIRLKGDDEPTEYPVRFAPPQRTRAVIMLGAGAARWLHNVPSHVQLHATQHAVQLRSGQRRAWYGKMHLVPDDAIVQTVPTTQTFANLKNKITTTSIELATGRPPQDVITAQRLQQAPLAVGCGSMSASISNNAIQEQDSTASTTTSRRHRRRLQHVGSPSECNNVTNFFCWYQCLDIPDASNVPDYVAQGQSLYCLDPAVLHKSAGDVQAATEPCEKGFVHNAACTGSWQPTAEGVHLTVEFEHQQHSNHSGHDGDNKSTSSSTSTLWDPDRFCYGGTSMYMDGFHWVHDSLCVIYLFPGWVLSTKAKLAAASVGTVVMAALLEGIIWQRRELLRTLPAGGLRLSVGSLLYGVQLSLGYLVMLVIMTYSGVLFLCTVTGLVLGNVLFNAKDGLMASRRRENPQEESAAHGIPADGDHQFDKDGDLPMKSAPCGCEDKAYTVESGNAPSDHDIPDGATPCCQHAS